MKILWYYDGSKNPDRAHLLGVPLDNLTDEYVAGLPKWLQRSIAACPFYVKNPPVPEVIELPAKQKTEASK